MSARALSLPGLAHPDIPTNPKAAQRTYCAARDRADIAKEGGIHSLRHAFATHLLEALRSRSIPYRIALGPHAGRKAFTLQTLPSSGEFALGLARANGFSHPAGVVAASDERDTPERLDQIGYFCRSSLRDRSYAGDEVVALRAASD